MSVSNKIGYSEIKMLMSYGKEVQPAVISTAVLSQ